MFFIVNTLLNETGAITDFEILSQHDDRFLALDHMETVALNLIKYEDGDKRVRTAFKENKEEILAAESDGHYLIRGSDRVDVYCKKKESGWLGAISIIVPKCYFILKTLKLEDESNNDTVLKTYANYNKHESYEGVMNQLKELMKNRRSSLMGN